MHASFIRQLLRRTLVFSLVCGLFASSITSTEAAVRRNRPTGNSRYASIIMDAQSGEVLASTNPDKKLYPASLTKMMTLFLAFESLERGRLYMDKYLTISTNATRQPPTKLGVRPGDKFTVKQAILALITRSANDVAVVLAENIGGSEANFAKMMTKRAQSLGMKNTHFVNASGLPNGAQMTSVRDMAILSRALMQYFPNQYPLFATRSFVYKREVITNHNHLMERFKGMDGLKTGFINASGFNLAASAVRNNRRLIVVVFGGRSAASRDAHVAELFNRGFAMLPRKSQTTQMASAASTPRYTPPQEIVPIQSDTRSESIPDPISPPQPVARETGPAPIEPINLDNARVASAHKPAVQTAQAKPAAAAPAPEHGKGWVPDGGQVRTLQLPNSYPQPTAQAPQAIQPIEQPQAAPQDANAVVAGVLSPTQPAPYRPSSEASSGWGIQVGAYTDIAAGQQALAIAQRQLGGLPRNARGVIVPAQTPSGTIYRARILGLSSQAANQACSRLNDCMIFTIR